MNMDNLIALSVKHNASDLHLCVGQVPVLRVDGELFSQTHCAAVTDDALRGWVKTILDQANYHRLMTKGQADLALFIRDQPLRVNIFMAGGLLNAALRLISPAVPSLEDILAPPVFAGLLSKTQSGLILVTGATGSGKSSTLAAMLRYINQHFRRHVITLEDPVEFRHRSRQSLIRQREIGRDCEDYQQGLTAALRQDPDVIMLGELRDEAAIRLALTAAETGHLVFSTLHTIGAANTVDRIIDVFPANQQRQIAVQLSMVLQAVISQQLVPTVDGKQVPVFEIMTITPAIRNMIRDNKVHQIDGLIATSAKDDMISMDMSLMNLCKQGIITKETALTYASNPEMLKKRL